MSRNAGAMRSHASADSIVASKFFGKASGSFGPAERPFDDSALRQHDEALDLFVIAADDGDGDTARLEGGAPRLVALVA